MNQKNTNNTVYEFQSGINVVINEYPIKTLYITKGDKVIPHQFIDITPIEFNDDNELYENNILLVNYTEEQKEYVLNKLKEYDNLFPEIEIASNIVKDIEDDYTDRRGLKHVWYNLDEKKQEVLKFKWSKIIAKMMKNNEPPQNLAKNMIENLLEIETWNDEWYNIDASIRSEIIEEWISIVKNNMKI